MTWRTQGFAGLKPQRPVITWDVPVWIMSEATITKDRMGHERGYKIKAVDDPVLRLQRLIEAQVQPHVAFSRVLSFAKVRS